MKRYLFSLFAILCVAASAFAAKVYVNPGHGSWHQNSRNLLTISVPRYNDTLGFYESNTNLWKCLILEEKLLKDGHTVKMSRRASGGTWQQSNSTLDKKLSVIAMEAENWGANYFISVHSNAASSVTVNYPAYFYRGKDGKAYVTNSDKMCKKAWPHTFIIHDNGMEPHSYWSMSNPGVYADITAMSSSSTVNGYTGYFGVLKHGRPGYLIEGYFHTYGPARHRALNPDWCRQEGIRHYRGIRQWYRDNGSGSDFGKESKGYFMGYVRTKDKTMDSYSNYYTYSTSTKNANYNKDDKYMPINGAKVQLKDANGNIVKTNCYYHVKRMLKNQDYYTTDNNWNGVFVFQDLTPGTYTYTVYANGYKDVTGTVTIKADETSYAKVWMTSGSGSTPSEPTDPTPSTITVSAVWEKSNVKTPILENIPTVGSASRGGFVVKGGKIYLQDKANKKLLVYNASTGAYESQITGTPDAYHLNLDNKGNAIYNVWRNGFTGFHLQAFDIATGTLGKDFGKDSVTLTTRADYATVYGDMLTGTGYAYAVGNEDKKLVRQTYTNGTLTKAETFTLSASAGGSNYVTVVDANNCIINLRSSKIVWYDMANKKETELGLSGQEACASVGGAYFELNKKQYFVQAFKLTNNYQGNFKIYDITSKTASEIFHRNSNLGTVSNSGTTNVMFRTIVNGNKAYIYEYVPGNGMACYVLTDSSMEDTPSTPEDPVTPPTQGSISWNLNGGQTNPYGWTTKEDMWKQFMADYRTYYGVSATDCPDTDIKNAAGFTWKTKKMRDFLTDNKSSWKWLGTYITDVVEGQGGTVEPDDSVALAKPLDNIEPFWRYHVNSFFGDTLRADIDANNDGNIDLTDTKEHFWPQSGDFTNMGVSNVINWYQYSGYYIGNYPTSVTDTFQLPIPHKSGEHFGGWYTNSSCTGTAISSVAPGETITLYALWGEPTTPDVVWVLNGGKVGGAVTIPTNEELWNSFKEYFNTYYVAADYEDAKNNKYPRDITTSIKNASTFWPTGIDSNAKIMTSTDSKFKWLGDYISAVATAQGYTLDSEGAWRMHVHHFFNCSQRTETYLPTANFSEAGKPSAWGPAYQAANGGAAIELPSFITSAYTIPTPTKENDTFIGWYDNNNGTGTALTVLQAGYKGTVYAIWKSMGTTTELENIRPTLDTNAPMYDLLGRQVNATYRGIIIQNGNKYLLR